MVVVEQNAVDALNTSCSTVDVSKTQLSAVEARLKEVSDMNAAHSLCIS